MAGSYSARSALMAPLHWPTLPPPRTARLAYLLKAVEDVLKLR